MFLQVACLLLDIGASDSERWQAAGVGPRGN
jgi:hypothetical protein